MKRSVRPGRPLQAHSSGCLHGLSPFQGSRAADFQREGQQPAVPLCARILALVLFLTGLAEAQDSTGKKNAAPPPPGVEARLWAEPEKATVGDPIRIELDLSLPKGYEIRMPPLGTQVGDFSILELFPGPSVPDLKPAGQTSPAKNAGIPEPAGTYHYRARIVASVYKTGKFTFPPLEITLRDPAGKETILPTSPAIISIESVLSEKDQNLKDLKKQAELPVSSRWLLWLALGLVALILSALAWWFYRRRVRPSTAPFSGPRLDPFELAQAELRDLLGRGLLEKRLVKQFYVALSEIVKRILEAGYGIAAAEKTTDEILEAFRAQGVEAVPQKELDCIASFLSACDLVKFAKGLPSPPENDEAVKSATRILSLCRQRRSAPAAPVPASTGGGS